MLDDSRRSRSLFHVTGISQILNPAKPRLPRYINLSIKADYETIKDMIFMIKPKGVCTLFPRQPMMPQPIQETLGCCIYGRRQLRTQIEISIPTICLLIIHLKSWGILLSELLLFRAPLISAFHFMAALLFSDPRIFAALRGTTSWNLNIFT